MSEDLVVQVRGMDCAHCARTVQQAISGVPGVQSAEVLLSVEKAVVTLDESAPASLEKIRKAVEESGYTVPVSDGESVEDTGKEMSRHVIWLFALIFGVVLLVVVVGEWLNLFDILRDIVPLPVGILLVLLFGYPIFVNVVKAALKRRIVVHTLMAVGAIAALVVGEWVTAILVVFFMRVGDYAERFTTERSRDSLRSLTRMAPRIARVERGDEVLEVKVQEVSIGDIVQVRPGEIIPVDGEVIDGQATINQAAITGESMPVEAAPGSRVFASTIAELGVLRIRSVAVGEDTTFGHVIKMVEEAELHKGDMQRLADKFSGYYLPIVLFIAAVTYVLSQNVLSTVAVLVVACACAIALATPVAILASVGAAAKRGVLIKGGLYIETLDRVNVVLLDKTGTLTLGRPRITDIVCVQDIAEEDLLALAASAEQHSEHPLAGAVLKAADSREISLLPVSDFEAVPGKGVHALVDSRKVTVGSPFFARTSSPQASEARERLESEGKTILVVEVDGNIAGILAAADTEREEVPEALNQLTELGIEHIELLTGDNEKVASLFSSRLGIDYQANLLPEDKIEVVRQYQKKGMVVAMIGDGVNDAPALAQADVGIAMAAVGSDVAVDAAHVALMSDDWRLVPELFRISNRTMRVVRLNLGFTAAYNIIGVSLAAFGILPPILAAAAQSLPDLGILANSTRLIKQ
jgi:P-type Cu+ transporter